MNSCYRAGGEAKFGAILEISCLFGISVPATWIAGMVLHLPFLAVFSFVYTDELIRLVFELWYTKSGRWVKPVTEQGKRTLEAFRKELKKAVFSFVYTDELIRLVFELWYTKSGRWVKPVTEQGKRTLEAFRKELKKGV